VGISQRSFKRKGEVCSKRLSGHSECENLA
jgi:hypothetical protein